MKLGGPLFLTGAVVLGFNLIPNPAPPPSEPRDSVEPMQLRQSLGGGGNDTPGGTNDPNTPGGTNDTVGANDPPSMPPPNPPDGTIPPGAQDSITGKAAICFDGSGYHPPGDTYSPRTAYEPGGIPLNGDTTPYVVVNAQDAAKYPLGSYVYAYNNETHQGVKAIVGDHGPTQSVNEMSTATANALGLHVSGNSVGYARGNNANVTYYHYGSNGF